MRDDIANTSPLKTILEYCDLILDAMDFFGHDEEDFFDNRFYQVSCSFSLFQIGEAVKRMPFIVTDDHPDVDWSGIARLRDIIAHQYENVELPIIWSIITEQIPVLKQQCEKILRLVEDRKERERRKRTADGGIP
ncbi:MAG: DUF86 domain-containing protein [Methanomassiliicoccaceae archaeon]|nr:DUF86 domain-containing protein [Methanomassiliicoccaceae archaeon]